MHTSQRSSSGQPGECHLSSPQRHARRRRGELRAHWDAGDRLEWSARAHGTLPQRHLHAFGALGATGCALGMLGGCERTLGHNEEPRARATPTRRVRRRDTSVRVAHMVAQKQLRGQAKGHPACTIAAVLFRQQPGECHLSSPQRHARRRRGELRAHWDAGNRLEHGQAHRRERV